MTRSVRVVWLSAVVVLVLLTIAVLVVDGPLPGEVWLILRLQELGRPVPFLADVLRATTGTEGNLVVGALPAALVIRRFGRRGVAAVAICLVAMLVVQPVSKELVDRDRPAAPEVEVRASHSSRSFPSGHSLSTTTVWGAAALFAWRTGRRTTSGVLAAPIVATAISSGVHGVHWASDAIAGTIIGGGAAAWAVELLLGPLRPEPLDRAVEHFGHGERGEP